MARDLFKKFVGTFVEVEQKEKKKVPVMVEELETPVTYNPPVYVAEESMVPIKEKIEEILKSSNKVGYDYYEFRAVKGAMNSVPLEATRYQAAFAGAQASGLSKEGLLDSAKYYIDVINGELEAFSGTYQTMYEREVTQKEQKIQAIANEMTELNNKINQLNEEISKTSTEVSVTKATLESKKSIFLQAAEECKQDINKDILNINNYIK